MPFRIFNTVSWLNELQLAKPAINLQERLRSWTKIPYAELIM